MLPASWTFAMLWNEIRSLNTVDLKSIAQWAAKLLAFKVEVLKKKSAISAIPNEVYASAIGLGLSLPGFNNSQSLMADNFAAFWLSNLILTAFKNLTPFQIFSKFQEAGSILRVDLPSQSDLIFIGFILYLYVSEVPWLYILGMEVCLFTAAFLYLMNMKANR